jgi:PAS domain-containing protein
VSDFTPSRLTEEAFRASRLRLEAALSSTTDAVFITDADGRFVDFNDTFATFHRFKDKSACPKTIAEYPELLEMLMPDGALVPLDMWLVPRALRGDIAADVEYIVRRKDTGETWAGSYSYAPFATRPVRSSGLW